VEKTIEDLSKIAQAVSAKKITNPPFDPEYIRALIKDIRVLMSERKSTADNSTGQMILEKIFIDHLKNCLGLNASLSPDNPSFLEVFLKTIEDFLDRIEKH